MYIFSTRFNILYSEVIHFRLFQFQQRYDSVCLCVYVFLFVLLWMYIHLYDNVSVCWCVPGMMFTLDSKVYSNIVSIKGWNIESLILSHISACGFNLIMAEMGYPTSVAKCSVFYVYIYRLYEGNVMLTLIDQWSVRACMYVYWDVLLCLVYCNFFIISLIYDV